MTGERNLDEIKRQIQENVERMRERLIEISLEIHSNPETKFEEKRACKLLCRELSENGFQVKTPVAGMDTAFVADGYTSSRSQRPRLAFMCEYDALPEMGHACGHNLIAAASLGAGLALKNTPVPATVTVMGTPAEEGGGGKRKMIDEGVFDFVDAAFMFHPSHKDEVGERMMAVQEVEVYFSGKAAHAAARPEEGVNALDAVINVFNSLNALRQHMREDVRVHGVITDGGTYPNIVPEHASCLFFLRAQEQEELEELLHRFGNIVKGAELATGARANINYLLSYRARNLNRSLVDALKNNLEQLGREPLGPRDERGTVSSDFGDVSQVVPAVHPFLSIGENIVYHTKEFTEAAKSDWGHETMIIAAKALAMTAADMAMNENVLNAVRMDHSHPPEGALKPQGS